MIDVKSISTHCTRTEFVGTTVLDTIGLVISGIDDTLLKEMNVGMKYHALGLFSSHGGETFRPLEHDPRNVGPCFHVVDVRGLSPEPFNGGERRPGTGHSPLSLYGGH